MELPTPPATVKATPEQWAEVEAFGSFAIRACILELRDRVMTLEAQASNYPVIPDSSTPPPVATDEELRAAWDVHYTARDAFRALSSWASRP